MVSSQNAVKSATGAYQVVKALEDAGVSQIFGYPGACILSLYDELASSDQISHCLCRHEQACVHAAEGYARVSGKIGVVLVTSGPGATNTVTGIANAYADSTPLLVLAGTTNESSGKIFQYVDFESMVKSTVKKIYSPKEDESLYDVIFDAINTANEGKRGPVVVQLSRAALETSNVISFPQSKTENLHSIPVEEINYLINLLSKAKNPLFLIGGGCRDSFLEISELAAALSINVVTTLMGVGCISSQIPTYKGMIGVNGLDEANEILFNSDLIVAFGVAYSDRSICKSRTFANGTPVVNINIEPYRFDNVNIVGEITADCNDVLKVLKQKMIPNIQYYDLVSKENKFKNSDEKMMTEEVLSCINEYTKQMSPIVITDVGQHQMVAAQCFEFTAPRRFLTSGGLGTMGFGLPASCGVYFAAPNACIINITGDGSFQMNIQELATVREYQIPVKIFVMNNGYLGMIRQAQEKLYEGRYYQSKMNNPDFITLANGYDIEGYRVTSTEQLQELLPIIFGSNKPTIVDCITKEIERV